MFLKRGVARELQKVSGQYLEKKSFWCHSYRQTSKPIISCELLLFKPFEIFHEYVENFVGN